MSRYFVPKVASYRFVVAAKIAAVIDIALSGTNRSYGCPQSVEEIRQYERRGITETGR